MDLNDICTFAEVKKLFSDNNMNIIETIPKRRSVRTYTGEPVEAAVVEKIKKYISGLEPPFGVKCRIEVLHTELGAEPVKLGTYGFIKGASTYLALIMEEGALAEEGAAYLFEQVVLYCTSLGLGTCWLGVSFNKSTFKKHINLRPGEQVRIVSPVGYPSDKRHLSLFLVFGSSKSDKRKPFTANFFNRQFGNPLTEEAAGIFARPLEMVRLAPSANNTQSWRVVKEEDVLHFYRTKSHGFDRVDVGIALCHFEQSCRELGIKGRFEVLQNTPPDKKAMYVISWVTLNL